MKWFSAIGGAVATAAAVVTLGAVVATPVQLEEAEGVVSTVYEVQVPVERAIEEFVYELPAVKEPVVHELSASVSEVLAKNGYTEFVGTPELLRVIPREILDALIANNSVLIVSSEGGE